MRGQNHVHRRESDRRTDRQTDRQTVGQGETNIPPKLRLRGYNKDPDTYTIIQNSHEINLLHKRFDMIVLSTMRL